MATARKKVPAKKAPAKKAAAKKAPARKLAAGKVAAAAPAPKPAARPAPAADTPRKPDKAKKPKLVRDSYTISKSEYAVLEQMKLRAARLGRPAKKSEVLRAGLKALAAMDDASFVSGLASVPALKTGRPAGS